MASSQNGYKANDSSLIASYTVGKAKVKIALRKGDVSVVLLHYLNWYDANIEPLRQKDTGGYNPRKIEGSETLSNHASGTAGDHRWQDHPLGKANTFSAAEQKKIRTQLKFYEGVLRWGGDYKGRKDDMHVEINKGSSEVARIAKKCKNDTLNAGKKPSNPVKYEDMKLEVDGILGARSIGKWQHEMGATTSTKLTPTFIKSLQTFLTRVDHRLKVDGVIGPITVRALQRYLKAPTSGLFDRTTIRALQRRLNTGQF